MRWLWLSVSASALPTPCESASAFVRQRATRPLNSPLGLRFCRNMRALGTSPRRASASRIYPTPSPPEAIIAILCQSSARIWPCLASWLRPLRVPPNDSTRGVGSILSSYQVSTVQVDDSTMRTKRPLEVGLLVLWRPKRPLGLWHSSVAVRNERKAGESRLKRDGHQATRGAVMGFAAM